MANLTDYDVFLYDMVPQRWPGSSSMIRGWHLKTTTWIRALAACTCPVLRFSPLSMCSATSAPQIYILHKKEDFFGTGTKPIGKTINSVAGRKAAV
jgi:hypothetical protein